MNEFLNTFFQLQVKPL